MNKIAMINFGKDSCLGTRDIFGLRPTFQDEHLTVSLEKDAIEREDVVDDVDDTVSPSVSPSVSPVSPVSQSFLLPHPGFKVTSLKYDGNVKSIRKTFRILLDKLVRVIFAPQSLVIKKIHGKAVDATELFR